MPDDVRELARRLIICRDALEELCSVKSYKDAVGKDALYQQRQPRAWIAANEALNGISREEADTLARAVLEQDGTITRMLAAHDDKQRRIGLALGMRGDDPNVRGLDAVSVAKECAHLRTRLSALREVVEEAPHAPGCGAECKVCGYPKSADWHTHERSGLEQTLQELRKKYALGPREKIYDPHEFVSPGCTCWKRRVLNNDGELTKERGAVF